MNTEFETCDIYKEHDRLEVDATCKKPLHGMEELVRKRQLGWDNRES